MMIRVWQTLSQIGPTIMMGAMAKDARQILMHRLFRGSFRRFIHVGSFLDLPHPGKLSARGTSPATS